MGALSTQDSKAIIMISDIFGWNSGRLRAIADMFSEKTNSLVVIPMLLVPPFEGGTDGDGFPPNFNMGKRFMEASSYLKTITWEEIVKPRLSVIHSILLKKGGDSIKISAMGFCWGGWAVTKMLSEPELFTNITCGITAHPSVSTVEANFGGDTINLLKKVSKPILFLPASNDPPEYSGSFLEAVKENNPLSYTINFPDVVHGFYVRGDIGTAEVRAAFDKATQNIL